MDWPLSAWGDALRTTLQTRAGIYGHPVALSNDDAGTAGEA
jgi:hypothetical protein